jgi:hypothetical protein
MREEQGSEADSSLRDQPLRNHADGVAIASPRQHGYAEDAADAEAICEAVTYKLSFF